MAIHVGTSGWSYDHWEGILYPAGTPTRKRLAYYIEQFNTVEINNSFYRWPSPENFESWQKQVPDGFEVAVKAPRYLTHYRRLKDPDESIGRVSNAIKYLGTRRGPLLVQLPPNLPCDPPRLDYFLAHMPPWVRIAMEFRHPGWHTEEIYQMLDSHRAAYCVMSGGGLPCVLRATAPFVYVRLHGPEQAMYAGSYPEEDLAWWAERAREWQDQGRDVYLYFNNDVGGHAVHNAHRLRELLGQ